MPAIPDIDRSLGYAANELGIAHLDVELNHLREGAELDVDPIVGKPRRTNDGNLVKHMAVSFLMAVGFLPRITYIQENGDGDDDEVEAIQGTIFAQAVGDQT